jgi:hypothetical protein
MLALLLLLAAPASASYSEVRAKLQQRSFPAPAAGACGLKRFSVADYETRAVDGPLEKSRISVMGAVVETTAPSCAKDYGVVQYIRGCVYHVRYDAATGAEKERTFDVARRLRGPRVVFSHPVFEVDRTDEDPLYASDPSETDRMALVYAPKAPLRLRDDRASLLADMKAFDNPAHRTFYADLDAPGTTHFITDVPEGGVTTLSEDGATLTAVNASLDFKTCVFRVADVPVTGEPAQAAALHCFAWQSRYDWDMAARDFVTDRWASVDPYCASAPARVPLPE